MVGIIDILLSKSSYIKLNLRLVLNPCSHAIGNGSDWKIVSQHNYSLPVWFEVKCARCWRRKTISYILDTFFFSSFNFRYTGPEGAVKLSVIEGAFGPAR
jgi:hypothetical protein